MGSLEDIASYVVNKGTEIGLDEVAALVSHRVYRQVRFSKNVITVTKVWDSVDVGILISKEKRIAKCTTGDPSGRSLSKAIENLKSLANVMRPHESYTPLPKGPFRYATIRGIFDSRIPELGDKCVDYAEGAINSALESGGKSVAGTLLAGDRTEVLETSSGVQASERRSSVSISVRSSVRVGGITLYGLGTSCGRTLSQFEPLKAGEESGRYASLSSRIVKTREGRYDAVFGRPALGNLLGYLSFMASAFYVDSGISFLEGRIGKRVGSNLITFLDDPTMDGGLGSRAFDMEGRPTQKTSIIDRGVLRTYLHNRLTATKFGAESTSNAGWVVPQPWNLYLAPGTHEEEELVESLRDGIFVNNATYTRFQNYRTGDFSSIIRDGVFRIINGEIAGAVHGLRLSDNLDRMLTETLALSRASEQVMHWWMEVPVTTPNALLGNVGFTLPTA
ncbi:MAG: TldD/PmbA family protein [Candidatus Bathyarchaeia archaeon]